MDEQAKTPLLSEEEENDCEHPIARPFQDSTADDSTLHNGDAPVDLDDNNSFVHQDQLEFSDFLQKYTGDNGPHQWIGFIAVFVADLVNGMLILSPVFIAAIPEHTCSIDKYTPPVNCSDDVRRDVFFPREERHGRMEPSQCQYYDTASLWKNISDQDGCKHLNFTGFPKKDCDEWTYDTAFYTSTIVTEWDLVCSKSSLVANAATAYWIGVIAGLLIGGYLADRWGRKPMSIVGYIMFFILVVASSLSPNYWVFLLLRCLMALFITFRDVGVWIAMYEILGDRFRLHYFAFENLAWCGGSFLMAVIAYFERRWRYLQIYIVLPEIVGCLIFVFYHTESPRWLLTRDKKATAMKHLYLIAKRNRKVVPPDVIPYVQKESQTISIHQLMVWPAIRKVTLVQFYLWMGMGLIYYGISMNTGNLGGNPFVNFIVSGIADLISGLVALVFLKKFGRVGPFSYGLLVGGVVLILAMAVPAQIHWMILMVAMLGKLCTAIPGNATWLYALEVYPTSVRSIGVHACSILARVGAIGASYLGLLTHDSRALPLLIFGISAITGGLLAFILPETKDQPLTQTIEEGEEFMQKNMCKQAPWANKACCHRRSRARMYRTVVLPEDPTGDGDGDGPGACDDDEQPLQPVY